MSAPLTEIGNYHIPAITVFACSHCGETFAHDAVVVVEWYQGKCLGQYHDHCNAVLSVSRAQTEAVALVKGTAENPRKATRMEEILMHRIASLEAELRSSTPPRNVNDE